MTAALAQVEPAPAPPALHGFDALTIERELPDTARAAEFDGHAMVQSFAVPLPGGQVGRCWITTADAFRVPCFGRGWISSELRAHAAEHGPDATCTALASAAGLRMRVP